jgi:arsenical pump membrane protein
VFVAGLLLLVEVLTSAGLLDGVGDTLGWLADRPAVVAVVGAAAIGALLSNVLNNWPAALLLSAAIAATPGQPHELAAGALIGCTIGANFTIVGSLSTVFWMSLGRPRGLAVTPGAYAREAAAPTALALIAACLAAAAVATVRQQPGAFGILRWYGHRRTKPGLGTPAHGNSPL